MKIRERKVYSCEECGAKVANIVIASRRVVVDVEERILEKSLEFHAMDTHPCFQKKQLKATPSHWDIINVNVNQYGRLQ